MTLQEFLMHLKGVKGSGPQYSALCPVHGDKNQSLSVSIGNDGRILLHCHAGCSTEDIVWAMGLQMRDLFVDLKPGDVFPVYEPPKDQGKAWIEREHVYPGGQIKKVVMRKPDGGKFAYWMHLENGNWTKGRGQAEPPLYATGPLSDYVYIVEGEKDVDTMKALGASAVSLPDGAKSKWLPAYGEALKGRRVTIIPDNDSPGQELAQRVAGELNGLAQSVKVLDLAMAWPEIPNHGDVSDMVAALEEEKTAAALIELERNATEWAPAPTEEIFRKAKTAADFKDADTRFLWYPYLPIGDYSVMMADGGTGKTILCCGIASVLSNGELFPGEAFFRAPQDTLIISAEDTGEVLKGRLKKSGADLTRIKIIDCRDSVGMSISEGYEEFRATIQNCAPALVIVDPWHAFLGEKVDISRVNAVRPLLQKLANIAKECSCAMILVSHVNKRAQGENANNAATGSTDFINAARSAFRVIFDGADDDCRIMVHTKTNYAPYGQSIKYRIDDGGVVWVGFSEITRSTLEAAARKHSTPHETLIGAEKKAEANAGLIAALKASAGLMAPMRFSYEEFKQKHGELIFGAQQPKKALDNVKKVLETDGYFLRVCQVKKDGKAKNGFLIQRIGDLEYEQVNVFSEPGT